MDTDFHKDWTWVLSSAGRASPLQGESRRFDPVSTHHSLKSLPKYSINSIIAKDFKTSIKSEEW